MVVRQKEVSNGKRSGSVTRRTSICVEPHPRATDVGRGSRRFRAAQRRHRPKMWCRWPSIAKPIPVAISSCSRSISALWNSKISPHATHTKWSWWSRFQTGSKRASLPKSSSLARPASLKSLSVR